MNRILRSKRPAERRKFNRYDMHAPLVLSDGEDHVLDKSPLLRDISLGGFGFITTTSLEPGVSFRFRLEFPKRKAVSGIAKTRWVKSHRDVLFQSCGAQIISLRWGHKAVLNRQVGACG